MRICWSLSKARFGGDWPGEDYGITGLRSEIRFDRLRAGFPPTDQDPPVGLGAGALGVNAATGRMA